MEKELSEQIRNPGLHGGFTPCYEWWQDYKMQLLRVGNEVEEITISIRDAHQNVSSMQAKVFPRGNTETDALTRKWVERIVKMLLWQRGGNEIWLSDREDLVSYLRETYSATGLRSFDYHFFSDQVYHKPLEIHLGTPTGEIRQGLDLAGVNCRAKGCRIGYDLGGSDRKCAAIVDGEVVFSEEIEWNPYHQNDPSYHINGIRDSLARAAKHLPRVDAIGGSSAGVIIDHVPEVGSLFRGLNQAAMETQIRPFFRGLSAEWGGIPVTLLNDGEVTALAGSNWLGKRGVLGISMGTSMASGYVDPQGRAGIYFNELAFCPVDLASDAAVDEWSGDRGCGVQYFSQQAVVRLAKVAGIHIPVDMPAAEGLKRVQKLADEGDLKAISVFRQIGFYLGKSLPFWKLFYDFEHLLLLGRVVSGIGGDCIVESAKAVIAEQAWDPHFKVRMHIPDETFKRHGQAIAAASVPQL